MSRVAGASLYVMHANGSDPWNDVTHEGSVDPVGNVIIYIYNLEKLRNFRVFGAANVVNHVNHPPGPVCVLDDHCHFCLDVERQDLFFGAVRCYLHYQLTYTSLRRSLLLLLNSRVAAAHEITLI